ncbi:MAG: isoprenoid biosynthesis glyoxalase ElbB [Opitutaceae bacterium]|jgi:enhancing lycopene biosynthesis protein 2|nr:isoprenoid biosynthesis glyoxalase ElbB [Opitutaceae bacterium]
MKKVAVILSGCGVFDGSEIQEAVITLLAIDRAGAAAKCFAPDVAQMHVVNHADGKVAEGVWRNVLEESARIARGNIAELAALRVDEVDAIILPGGFGAAKNLCDFATAGAAMTVMPGLERLLTEAHAAGRPLGFACIAPVIAAKVFGAQGVQVTIGNDRDTAAAIEAMGAKHVECPVEAVVADRSRKIFTTPAYMLGPGIRHVAAGIEKLVAEVLAAA